MGCHAFLFILFFRNEAEQAEPKQQQQQEATAGSPYSRHMGTSP